jgi:hypothetical protein
MNEKIKELALQAEVWNTDGDYDKCEVDLGVFAKLIIQECIRLCDEIEDDYLKGEDRNTDIGVGAGTCAYEIEKHFGVE